VKDIYFQSNKTVFTFLLNENVHKTYNTFDSNFSTLKLYFYSKEYYNPKPVVTDEEINEKSLTVKTVIIDPGHGGDDIGAKGKKGVMEKDITLAIAFKLSGILQERGYKVVMTRYSDTFVPLKERTGIANNNKGDIFISIHVNASVRKAYGAETYYLSLSGMEQVSDTVAFENRADSEAKKGKNLKVKPQDSDLMFILWDMAQTEYLKDSAELAEEIQKGMNNLTGIWDRGVKQAALVVLKGLNMPGVLVEVAFLSNPKEETKLTTDSFQKNVAIAIADSVDSYKIKYEAKMKAAKEAVIQTNNETNKTELDTE
jgi:N-acetylmuramoyl-L-alanine amidase